MLTELLMLAALAAQQGAGAPPVEVRALPVGTLPALVPLAELRRGPARYLGQEVRFAFQFHALVESWNPYLSRFDPARWLALEGWPDELFTWDKAVFDAPVGRLFVRRSGGFEPLARRAHAYERFEVRARVRESFLGEPWLEVLELVPLEGEVGEGTILCVTRARELAADGQFALALEQYERARSAPLPPHALAALLEEIQATEAAKADAKPDDRTIDLRKRRE